MPNNQGKAEQVYKALRSEHMELKQFDAGNQQGTINRIHALSGITKQNVRNNLARLKKHGRVHILAWKLEKYRYSAIWVKGAGEDAVPPNRPSPEEKRERHTELQRVRRARKAAGGDQAYELEKTHTFIEEAKKRPQGIFAALGL